MPIITLTTDLGITDHYVGTVKAAILRQLADAKIVDITHKIPPPWTGGDLRGAESRLSRRLHSRSPAREGTRSVRCSVVLMPILRHRFVAESIVIRARGKRASRAARARAAFSKIRRVTLPAILLTNMVLKVCRSAGLRSPRCMVILS